VKSTPFMIRIKVPVDVSEGDIHTDNQGEKFKITKIKSVRFLDMRTMQVTGLCVPVTV
jgi:hypothetical protein